MAHQAAARDEESNSEHDDSSATGELASKRLNRYRHWSYASGFLSLIGALVLLGLPGVSHLSQYGIILLGVLVVQAALYAAVGRYAANSRGFWMLGMGLFGLTVITGLLSPPRLGLIIGILGLYWGWRGREAIAVEGSSTRPVEDTTRTEIDDI